VAFLVNIPIALTIADFAYLPPDFLFGSTAIVLALTIGLVMPVVANIVPISRALSRTLRDSLDVYHQTVSDVTVKVMRVRALCSVPCTQADLFQFFEPLFAQNAHMFSRSCSFRLSLHSAFEPGSITVGAVCFAYNGGGGLHHVLSHPLRVRLSKYPALPGHSQRHLAGHAARPVYSSLHRPALPRAICAVVRGFANLALINHERARHSSAHVMAVLAISSQVVCLGTSSSFAAVGAQESGGSSRPKSEDRHHVYRVSRVHRLCWSHVRTASAQSRG
jgi:hypothetical protein